ncbi:hypothetical protein GOP47_0006614, partial [Adiantum capillus-veneris]
MDSKHLARKFTNASKASGCSNNIQQGCISPLFTIPPWGMDVKSAYQMLSSLTEEGTASIDDRDRMLVEVNITEAMVSEALKSPRGNVSLMSRNTLEESNATFILARTQDYTFKDLLHKEVELPLRIFTQHFTHGKAV